MCAELDGTLTKPFMSNFNDPGDICIFVRVPDGADLPTAMGSGMTWFGFSAAQHHCP
jgi:hypothetical protein